MKEDTNHTRAGSTNASPDLRSQLAELLATFDEIAQYGRERLAIRCSGCDQGEPGQ